MSVGNNAKNLILGLTALGAITMAAPAAAQTTDSVKNDPGAVLLELFARLMELLIERQNKVPDKNFLSFLDYVGIEASPGSPAEVPVTFLLPKSASGGSEVPEGSQAAR